MRDQYHAQLWQQTHEEIGTGIDGLLAGIMQAFRVLHRIEWSAPWSEEKPCQS